MDRISLCQKELGKIGPEIDVNWLTLETRTA